MSKSIPVAPIISGAKKEDVLIMPSFLGIIFT